MENKVIEELSKKPIYNNRNFLLGLNVSFNEMLKITDEDKTINIKLVFDTVTNEKVIIIAKTDLETTSNEIVIESINKKVNKMKYNYYVGIPTSWSKALKITNEDKEIIMQLIERKRDIYIVKVKKK